MSVTASLLDVRFIALLSVMGLLRFVVPTRYYVVFGVTCSAALLGLAAPQTLVVISVSTLLLVYPIHRLTRCAERRGASKRFSSVLLTFGMVVLVALLAWFKLYRHFALPWLGAAWIGPETLALVGFSYFILRAIGFLHIQSILKTTESNPLTLLFFLLFPPTLTSGPIQKFQDFRQQVCSPEPLSAPLLRNVAYRLTRGYFRKMVLAVVINDMAGKLLAVQHPSVCVSVASLAALYVFFYFDFAGYSDIAIAFGLLLGVKVPENFRQPFLATTASQFWRNWHITIVDWFRDQVFIPLGGMKGSRLRAASLAFLVMFLCGFWHGVAWGYIAWGAWHGLVLFTEALSGAKPIPPGRHQGMEYWSRVLWTNARVAFGGAFFLPSETALRLLGGFTNWSMF